MLKANSFSAGAFIAKLCRLHL